MLFKLHRNVSNSQVYSNDEFGLFTQVSGSGPLGPLVRISCSLFGVLSIFYVYSFFFIESDIFLLCEY